MKQDPRAIIIAGPTGAGKTTFAREFLPLDAHCPRFLNADLIAAGLAPFAPETALPQAREVMQQELRRLVVARESFALETTLAEPACLQSTGSQPTNARSIEEWQAAGYRVKLIFLQLDCAELAIARATQAALFSGARVAATAIRDEWAIGLENFTKGYAPRVDAWARYDTSGVQPVLLDWDVKPTGQSHADIVRDQDLRLSFNALRRATQHTHDMAMLTGTPITIRRDGVLEQISAGLERATLTLHEPAATYQND